MKALELTAETFEKEVLKSDIPVLVDFWAPWCMPCQMMAPVLDELTDELKGKIKITKLDTENPNHSEIASNYQIMSIPNMKLFKGGKVVDEFIGLHPKEMLINDLKKHIEKN